MIFIPCLDGRSHCPQEWASKEQVAAGTRVLAETLRALDALDAPNLPNPR
jgi:N-carbamoyl-L-amino-acid hydrolase